MRNLTRTFVLSFFTAMLLVQVGSLSRVRADENDATQLLERASANIAEVQSYTATQVSITRAQGRSQKIQQDIIQEGKSRVYVKTAGATGSNEIYFESEKLYIRLSGQEWEESSFSEFGISLDNIARSQSNVIAGGDTRILEDVRDMGEVLTHVQKKLRGEDLKTAVQDMYGKDSPISGVLNKAEYKDMTVDYYLTKDTVLIRRALSNFEYTYAGVPFSASTEVTYTSINEPVVFPADVPSSR